MTYSWEMISRIRISLSGLRSMHETLKPKKVTVFTKMFEREQRRIPFERLTSPLKGIAVSHLTWRGTSSSLWPLFVRLRWKDDFDMTVQENSLSHQIETMYRPALGVFISGSGRNCFEINVVQDVRSELCPKTSGVHATTFFQCFSCFGIGTSC